MEVFNTNYLASNVPDGMAYYVMAECAGDEIVFTHLVVPVEFSPNEIYEEAYSISNELDEIQAESDFWLRNQVPQDFETLEDLVEWHNQTDVQINFLRLA